MQIDRRQVAVVMTASAVALMSGCTASSGTAASTVAAPSSSSLSPAAPPDPFTPSSDSLDGSWASPELPLATWEASWLRQGGQRSGAKEFVAGFGSRPQATAGIVLKIEDGQWVLFQHVDSGPDTIGWSGKYTRHENVVHAASESCQIDYRVQVKDGSLSLIVLRDGPASNPDCGPNDLVTQKAIFQATPLHRVGG